MAQRMRPQLASAPNMAAFTREEEQTDLARVSAAFSSAAPDTVQVTSLPAPSPSAAIFFASSTHTVSRAAAKFS